MVDLPAPDGPTIATVLPAGTSKLTPFRIVRVGIVGKVHVVGSSTLPSATASGMASRPVDDLRADVEQVEHLLDVGQALADFAIDEADEVQRLRKLHQHAR